MTYETIRSYAYVNDRAVNIDSHSRKFVSFMNENGYDVDFRVIEGRGHCDLGEKDQEFFDLVAENIEKNS